MPGVRFNVAKHASNSIPLPERPMRSAYDLLSQTWGSIHGNKLRGAELLQNSFGAGEQTDFSSIIGQHNGFVHTITKAYNQHHHLVLRPDDVWSAVLGQFNFYVNAHAEELRSHFVQHEGKKELVVRTAGNRYTVDFGYLATLMTGEIHKNVVDPSLKDWILPDFTTTSNNDTVVCAVLMMATLKAYFNYTMELDCGIPSVTLEGEKADWEKLLARVDKFETFGAEPTAWAALLRPIFKRFVNAFDGEPDRDFWSRVCHYTSFGSGPTYLSGWITAFCVWNNEGKWQGPPLSSTDGASFEYLESELQTLSLDGVDYPIIDSEDVPSGFCEVDVKVDDNGTELECMMVSGHLATLVEGDKKDSVRPIPSWFMFIKSDAQGSKQAKLPEVTEL